MSRRDEGNGTSAEGGLGRVGHPRAKYVTGGEMGVAVVTAAQLSEVVREAVRSELGAKALLVDKVALSAQLGISPAHIDNLRKKGLPTVLVGQAVRFEPSAVLEWLRRGAAANE